MGIMKNVMVKAWEIARKGAARFGGSVKSYFAQALKMAWAIVKQGQTSTAELKAYFIGLVEQQKKNKDIRQMLEDNYEMALMHGQKAKADAQLARVKAEGAAIVAKINELSERVGGRDVLVAWVKEEAAARKAAKVVAA